MTQRDDSNSPRRVAPPPMDQHHLKKHFWGACESLRARFEAAGGLSPVSTGTAREWMIHDFLMTHLPGMVSAKTGHVLYHDLPSTQQDIIVYKNSGLALPIGNIGLVLPEGVIACVEVKSTLTKEVLTESVAEGFKSLQEPQPLKVIIARQLTDDHRYRKRIGEWLRDAQLPMAQLPDLVFVLHCGTVIRGGAIRTLTPMVPAASDPSRFYKFGDYESERWVGLALLVFEIAERATGVVWTPYLQGVLPASVEVV